MEIESENGSSLLDLVLSDLRLDSITPEIFQGVLLPLAKQILKLDFSGKPMIFDPFENNKKEAPEKVVHHSLNLASILGCCVRNLQKGTEQGPAFQLIESILHHYKDFYTSLQRSELLERESAFFNELRTRHPDCFPPLKTGGPENGLQKKSRNRLLEFFGNQFEFRFVNIEGEYASYVPFTFLVLLNFFGALGGFDLICLRIKESLTPIIALSTMKVLQDCSKLLSVSTVQSLYPHMKSIMEQLAPIIAKTEDIRSLKTSSTLDITFYFGSMFEPLFPAETKTDKNQFEVNLWLHLLTSANLEKRLFAQNEINNKIEHILSDFSSPYYNFSSHEMASLLLKNNYFDMIFGESAHHELIKLSFPFIKLLLAEGELTNDRLAKIFKLVKDKHDVTKNACLSVLSDLIEVLPYSLAALVVRKTLDDFLEKGDEHLLPILRRFFKNSRFNSRNPTGISRANDKMDMQEGMILKGITFNLESRLPEENIPCGLEQKPELEEPRNERERKNEGAEFFLEEGKEMDEEIQFFKLGESILSTLWGCISSQKLGVNKNLNDNIMAVIRAALMLRMSILRCEYLNKCLELLKDPLFFAQASQLIHDLPKGSMPIYRSRDRSGAICSKEEYHCYLLKEMMIEDYVHESLVTLKYEEIDENFSSDGEEGTQDMIEETQISESGGQEEQLPASLGSPFEPSEREDQILTIEGRDQSEIHQTQTEEGGSSRRNNSVELMTLEENMAPNEDDRDSFSTNSSVDREKVLNTPLQHRLNDSSIPGNENKKWEAGPGDLNMNNDGPFGEKGSQANQMSTTFGGPGSGGQTKNYKGMAGGPTQAEARNKPQFITKIEERLAFLKKTVVAAKERLSGGFIGFLWQYLVVNRLCVEELNLYFDFISECLVKTYFPIIEFDIVHSIFNNILLRLDYSTMTMPMYLCLETVILFLNKSFSIIKMDLVEGFQLLKPQLFGIEALWEVVFTCSMKKCSEAALNLLMKVFRKGSLLTEKPLNHLYETVIPQLFRRMEENYQVTRTSRDTEELLGAKLSLIRSVEAAQYLIEEFDQVGDHLHRKIVQEETISLMVDNNIGNSLPPKKFQIQVSKNIKVAELKKHIASKINPPVFPEEIMLFNKGLMLMEEKHLDSYKVQTGQTLCVSKNTTYAMEEEFFMSGGNNMIVEKTPMSSSTVKQRAEMICSVIPDLPFSFAEWVVLKKDDSEPDELILSLMDEFTLNDYKNQFENHRQMEERKKISANETLGAQPQGKTGSEEEVPMTLGKFIARSRTNFELIFAIEGLDIPELNSALWKLLQSLPVCEPILEEVAAVDKSTGVNSSKWEEVVIRDNIHQSLYNLTILKGKLMCRTLPESKEVQKSAEWRDSFLATGGAHFLVSLLKKTAAAPSNVSQTRYVALVMALVRGILNAYLLAAASSLENSSSIKEAILRAQNRKTSIANASSSSGGTSERTSSIFMSSKTPMSSPSPASSANMTPTFASPNTSRTHSSHSLLGNTREVVEEKKEEVIKVDEFDTLVSSISSKHFEPLKEVFVLPELVQCVMSHVTHCCKSFSQSQSESLELFEECIEFLIPCLAADQTLLAPLLEEYKVLPQLCEHLLISPQASIRKTIRHFIGVLSHNSLLRSTLADLLIPLAVHLGKQSAVNNDDFFFALIDFLEGLPLSEMERIIPLSDFASKMALTILNRPVFEGRHNEVEDAGLQGLMATLTTLVHTFPIVADHLAGFTTKNKSFVLEIYDFLFFIEEKKEEASESLDLPKCKRKITRQRAFELLLQMAQKNFSVFLEILGKVDGNHRSLETASLDTLNVELKGSTGFVGLKNFGCTCYINSLMQQLFMIPSFREKLLSIPVIEKPGEELKDNVLYQVQVIFANLSESVKQYFAPIDFCASFKGYDGLPMPLMIQQDVNEFFNMLCDRFEERIKGTPYASLFAETIQGMQCNQIISLEEDFPFVNQQEERFLTLSLEIKHRRNLFEALDAMLKGEKLEGENKVYSEKYQRKVDVQKRCILKQLPNTLIITLKRIEFDMVHLVNVKCNEYFEFPESFDIKRWTVYAEEPLAEGIMPDDSYFRYELVGVLVHSGFADYGHYYSFIKDRDKKKGKWFEFNDLNVRPFNSAFLKRECFGGASGEMEDFFGVETESQKSRNAYLLFYEKTFISPIEKEATSSSSPSSFIPKALEESEGPKTNAPEAPQPGYSLGLRKMVWKENYEHLRVRLLYDPDYFSFIKKFISYWMPNAEPPEGVPEESKSPVLGGLLGPEPSQAAKMMFPLTISKKKGKKQAQFSKCDSLRRRAPTKETFGIHKIHIAFHFAYESLIKLKDPSSFQQCIMLLSDMCDQYPVGSMYLLNLLSAQPSTLKDLILKPMLNEARHAFGRLIIKCFGEVFSIEKDLLKSSVFDVFDLESDETLDMVLAAEPTAVLSSRHETGGGVIFAPSSIVLRFLHVYCVSLGLKVQKHFRKAFEYFQVIKHLLHTTPQTLMYLHPKHAFDKLIQLFEVKWAESSIGSFSDPKMDPTLIQLLDIIGLWVLGTSRKIWFTTNIIPSPSNIFPSVSLSDLPGLSENTVKILTSTKWLTKIFPAIFAVSSSDSAIRIIERLCWADILTSSDCISNIKVQLTNDDLSFTQCPVDALFLIARAVLSVQDTEEYMQKRVTLFLDPVYSRKISVLSYLFAIKEAKRYFVVNCLRAFGDLVLSCKNQHLQAHFFLNSEKYDWVLSFLCFVQNDSLFVRSHQFATPIYHTIAKFKKILGREDKLLDDFSGSSVEPPFAEKHIRVSQPETIEEENPCHEEENEGDVEFDLESRSMDKTPEHGSQIDEEKKENN